MLVLLTCTCGGSQRLAMKPLARAGVPDYMDTPLYQGDKARQYASDICSLYPENEQAKELMIRIRNPRFVIVVGMDEGRIQWADVARNDTESMMRAEAIAKAFA